MTIKSWNQLPAGLLAPFPCNLSTFRKRAKKIVTSKVNSSADWVYITEVTWSEVMCKQVKWCRVKCREVQWKWREELMWFMWSASILKCSEATRAMLKSLGTKVSCTIVGLRVLNILWLLQLVCVLYCGCFNLMCFVSFCIFCILFVYLLLLLWSYFVVLCYF
jgi:hypothetical protein